jgi:hypothetical protein
MNPASVTHINTRQDMSSFARAHADAPVNWSVERGPGGTLIIVEHEDRSFPTGTSVPAAPTAVAA